MLYITYPQSGEIIYSRIYRLNGDIYNISLGDFESFNSDNLSDYCLLFSENSPGLYISDFPPIIDSGEYIIGVILQLGDNPNIIDEILDSKTFVWDGTTEIKPFTDTINISDLYTSVETLSQMVDYILGDISEGGLTVDLTEISDKLLEIESKIDNIGQIPPRLE
jgi:hypothetical protein